MATRATKPKPKADAEIVDAGKWRRDANGFAHFLTKVGCLTRPACRTNLPSGTVVVEAPKNTFEAGYCKVCHLEAILLKLNKGTSNSVRSLVDAEVRSKVELDQKQREESIAQREERIRKDDEDLRKREREVAEKNNQTLQDKDSLELGKAVETFIRHFAKAQMTEAFGGRRGSGRYYGGW